MKDTTYHRYCLSEDRFIWKLALHLLLNAVENRGRKERFICGNG